MRAPWKPATRMSGWSSRVQSVRSHFIPGLPNTSHARSACSHAGEWPRLYLVFSGRPRNACVTVPDGIQAFRDGNSRVSRLLLLLQCHHLGFEVGRYLSLERLIEENNERYYETL